MHDKICFVMSVFRVLNLVFLSFGACIIFLRTFKYNYKKAQAAWLRCLNGVALLTYLLFYFGVHETSFSLL